MQRNGYGMGPSRRDASATTTTPSPHRFARTSRGETEGRLLAFVVFVVVVVVVGIVVEVVVVVVVVGVAVGRILVFVGVYVVVVGDGVA